MRDIRPAVFPRDLDAVRTLFRAYADSLDFDLDFQDFDTELATLPGKYASPGGCVLLAWEGDVAVACVALRPINAGDGEMKRLYVADAARGNGLGRALAQRICDAARAAGYRRLCLDTVPGMRAAIALYRDLGFGPIEPYVYNPIPGALYLARVL